MFLRRRYNIPDKMTVGIPTARTTSSFKTRTSTMGTIASHSSQTAPISLCKIYGAMVATASVSAVSASTPMKSTSSRTSTSTISACPTLPTAHASKFGPVAPLPYPAISKVVVDLAPCPTSLMTPWSFPMLTTRSRSRSATDKRI